MTITLELSGWLNPDDLSRFKAHVEVPDDVYARIVASRMGAGPTISLRGMTVAPYVAIRFASRKTSPPWHEDIPLDVDISDVNQLLLINGSLKQMAIRKLAEELQVPFVEST